LPGYLGYDQPHRLCAGDMARTRVLCELHARQARDEGSYDAVPKDVSAGSNALLLPLRSCDKGSHCHLRGYARNRRASSADVCRFMPPAEDGDQTQMDKRDKYSTDYNAVTGAGDGAGGAPSDTYGPGSRTFRRTSSGTLIDTLRSPNSYHRLAEQGVMDQRQHSASGRAGVGARGWDDLRNANANTNVNESEVAPAPAPGYSPGAYGASYSSQSTGSRADNRPTLSLSPGDAQSNRQSSGSYSSPRRIRPPSFPQPQPTGPTPTDSRSPVSPAERGYYHPYSSSRQPEEEVTEWPAARPASYMNEGLRGNPRLY
jgi:hypothetical protein